MEVGRRTEEGTQPRDVCVCRDEFTAVLNTLTKAIYSELLDLRGQEDSRTNTAVLAEYKTDKGGGRGPGRRFRLNFACG